MCLFNELLRVNNVYTRYYSIIWHLSYAPEDGLVWVKYVVRI
jgi:hypothetical protein